MILGVSEKTLWAQINKQWGDIIDEANWFKFYTSTQELNNMEDCVQNIMDSCKAIMENIENLKGEIL